MKKIVPVIVGVVIITSLVYILSQSSRKVSQSVVNQQTTVDREPTTQPLDISIMPTNVVTTLATGITLVVTSPVNNVTVTSSTIVVKGKTLSGADVFVNDVETKADSNGNFSVSLDLDEGENYILIVANDINGNYSEKDMTVTYTP